MGTGVGLRNPPGGGLGHGIVDVVVPGGAVVGEVGCSVIVGAVGVVGVGMNGTVGVWRSSPQRGQTTPAITAAATMTEIEPAQAMRRSTSDASSAAG